MSLPENQSVLENASNHEERATSSVSNGSTRSVELPKLVDSKRVSAQSLLQGPSAIWRGDSETFLSKLPREPIFDLVVTSPPYPTFPKWHAA